MAEPTLQVLGEQIARIQSELRDLRRVRGDLAHLRAEIAGQRAETADLRTDVANRFDAVDTRSDQVQETAATNLAIVLEAIKNIPPKP